MSRASAFTDDKADIPVDAVSGPEARPFAADGPFGPQTVAATPAVNAYADEELRAMEGPPDGSGEPSLTDVPADKRGEVRTSTSDRLDALAGRVAAVADQTTTLGRVQPIQGQLINALMTAMDRVLADLGLPPVAWEEIVKAAGEEGR